MSDPPASCPGCGHENREGAQFCAGCGRGLQAACSACRAPLPGGARFCDRCGTPAGAAAAPARTPGDYTPRHLAERILRARAALEGERKHVTVLFADVKGSVELASDVDPEVWHGVMNRFFEILTGAVHRFEGTVNQYTGDGAMALFGAPLAHEDHAQRACFAALALRDELRGFAEELKRTRGLGFSTRLGLNSGEVVVGKIGDDLRMDYTAQGHTVSLAARMEQLAAPGNVYLTGNTARLVRGFFGLRDLGAFDLKGVREPVPVFELEGAGPLRTRLDRSRTRGLSRFVSRAAESERLDAALARAESGLQVVGLSGEGGVGKSRLCLEFVERCRAAGRTVLETHVPSHARSVPLLPWQTLFRDLLGTEEDDEPETARERIAGRLLRVVPESLEALPVLYEFLGVPDPGDEGAAADPERRQDLLLELLVGVLRARSREGAAVLLWEDLHWIDEASNRLLARLVAALAGTPLLLLLNFRPGYRAPWMLGSRYEELELEPLGAEGARELLGDLLGDDESVAELAGVLVERTGGNPFFLEEVVFSLIESGRLLGERGAYRAAGPLDALDVPPTVQTVLASRIDRLTDPAKQALQTAAVIGKRFPELLLRRVTGFAPAVCAGALDELRASELILAEVLHPSAEYAFKHPLIQDVAYGAQLGAARRDLHARVAREIERLGKRHVDESAGVIAHHLERGGQPLEAARWHAVAAERTRFIDASATVFHWQRVRALAAESDDSAEALDLRVRACSSALDVSGRAGLPTQEARALFEEGVRLASQSGDGRRALVRLHEAWAARLGWSGDPEGESRHLAEATRLAEELPDRDVRLGLLHRSFVAAFHRGDFRSALALSSRGVELAEAGERQGGGDAILYREQLLSKANAHMHLGDLSASAALLERADGVARRLGSARYGSRTMHMRALIGANLAVFRGEREAALREAREFVELTARTGSAWGRVVAKTALGRALLLDGQWAAARAQLEDSLARARAQQIGLESEAATLAYLAEALAGCGERDAALAAAEQGIALARERGARFWELCAQLALARVLSDEPARAEAALARAEVLIDETAGEVLRDQLVQLRAELGQRVERRS